MRRPGFRPAFAALAGAALLGAVGPGLFAADTVRVTIQTPVPARIDMEGVRRILVTRFIVDRDVPEIDLDREMVVLIRRSLSRKTVLQVLEVDPPPIPEQPLPDLLANSGFWRRLAETRGADLVISGKAGFEVQDRSGFVQVDEISPLTGQRVRRSRLVDREAFVLGLNLWFFRGSTGGLLYEDHFTGENTVNGRGYDRLAALYSLFEEFDNDILGIVVPSPRTMQRHLFTE